MFQVDLNREMKLIGETNNHEKRYITHLLPYMSTLLLKIFASFH